MKLPQSHVKVPKKASTYVTGMYINKAWARSFCLTRRAQDSLEDSSIVSTVRLEDTEIPPFKVLIFLFDFN